MIFYDLSKKFLIVLEYIVNIYVGFRLKLYSASSVHSFILDFKFFYSTTVAFSSCLFSFSKFLRATRKLDQICYLIYNGHKHMFLVHIWFGIFKNLLLLVLHLDDVANPISRILYCLKIFILIDGERLANTEYKIISGCLHNMLTLILRIFRS